MQLVALVILLALAEFVAFGMLVARARGKYGVKAPATTAAIAVTTNSDPHQKCSSRKPEVTGPMAAPAPAIPAHTAIALGRSWAGNTEVSSDNVDGMMNAAPIPVTIRTAMSCDGSPTNNPNELAMP